MKLILQFYFLFNKTYTFIKEWAFLSIQKVFSRKLRNEAKYTELHEMVGRGFEDIKIKGEKGLTQLLTIVTRDLMSDTFCKYWQIALYICIVILMFRLVRSDVN